MKNSFFTFLKTHWSRILSVVFFVFLSGVYMYIFAVGPFAPGEKLDPECRPTDSGCTVTVTSTYTNSNPSTTTVGGITSGSTFSGLTLQEMFDALLYPYVAISSNLTASLSLASGSSSREVGDTTTIALSWSAAKSSTDSNGKSFFIYGASAMTVPSGSSESSGTAPANSITSGSGVASPSGSITYTAPTSKNTNGGTGSFSYIIYPCAALQTSAGSCTQSDESGAYNTGNPPSNPDNVTSSTVTITYRYPIFYGSSATATPDTSIFSSLTKTVALSGRAGIGNTWNTTTFGHYTYFAWPTTYDNTCTYASGGSNVCFNANDANGAAVTDFERYTVVYTLPNSATLNYYVYRSANALSGSNARYYVF